MAQIDITAVRPLAPASGVWRFVRKLRPRFMPEGAILILILILVASWVVPAISPFDPLDGRPRDRLMAPDFAWRFWEVHFFGTDQNGRDVFVRVMAGAKYSYAVAFIAVIISGVIGLLLGMLAGFMGGTVDAVLMRIVDTIIAFPGTFLILMLAATFGPSLQLVALTLGFTGWAFSARLIRAQTLELRNRDFIRSARIAGAGNWRIIFKHVMPHILGLFIVLKSISIGGIILAEAGLSFIGAGIPPPTPAWGGMATQGRNYIQDGWWITAFPGLAIVVVVLCFTTLGEWLRDKLDPRTTT